MKVLHWPLTHFLLLGALLYFAQSLLQTSRYDTIRISPQQVETLRSQWRAQNPLSARTPSESELEASLRQYADEEILIREALRLGLDQTDAVVRRRLLQNMRFAFADAPQDDAGLLQQARDLGMTLRDAVIRERLLQAMQQRIQSAASFDETALREYIARHSQRYAKAARAGFSQIFFSSDVSRENAEAQAHAVLEEVRQGEATNHNSGDPFLLGRRVPLSTQAQIASRYGTAFAQAVMQAHPNIWIGPLRSPYGLHLVRVEQVEAATPADSAALRTQAGYAWLAEREHELLRETLRHLRLRYPVELVEGSVTR